MILWLLPLNSLRSVHCKASSTNSSTILYFALSHRHRKHTTLAITLRLSRSWIVVHRKLNREYCPLVGRYIGTQHLVMAHIPYSMHAEEGELYTPMYYSHPGYTHARICIQHMLSPSELCPNGWSARSSSNHKTADSGQALQIIRQSTIPLVSSVAPFCLRSDPYNIDSYSVSRHITLT